MEKENLLLDMIVHLRQKECILLFGKLSPISATEEEKTTLFLESEYNSEKENYPFEPPQFNPEAALWAAKTIYIAANLLLDRKHSPENLNDLIPIYDSSIDASAHLSADLCLRFLPVIITELKNIDPEDELIELLSNILNTWHYSGCSQISEIGEIDFSAVLKNECLHQLFCDRIIFSKNSTLARHTIFHSKINSIFGDYDHLFWPELNKSSTENNQPNEITG